MSFTADDIPRRGPWHTWFAWKPVKTDWHGWRWLVTVDRRMWRGGGTPGWDYQPHRKENKK